MVKGSYKSLIGQKFGRLTVCEHLPDYRVLCLCDCAVFMTTRRESLVKGDTQSCGCWFRESRALNCRTHGMTKSKEYTAWQNMLSRCYHPSYIEWHRYGGRGISVCDRWQESFENFFQDMGLSPCGFQLDRKNNDGNYEPGNCKWATPEENNSHTSRTRLVEIDGVILTLSQWSRKIGIDMSTMLRRMRYWPKERWVEPRQEQFVR